jgi:hypothetical protein
VDSVLRGSLKLKGCVFGNTLVWRWGVFSSFTSVEVGDGSRTRF